MATNYPGGTDNFTNPSGGDAVTSPSHASQHANINDAMEAVQNVLGTNSGTFVLRNMTAGQFAMRINSSSVMQDTITGGTLRSVVLGTPTVGSQSATGGTYTGGLFSAGTFGTPVITGGSMAVSGTVTPLTVGAGLVPSAGSLTDGAGGTFTVNAQANNVFFCALGTAAGNRTIGTPLNPTAWQSLTFGFKASGSSNGTLVWPSGAFTFSQSIGTPTLGTGVSWNYFAWRYNPVDTKWHFMGQSLNVV